MSSICVYLPTHNRLALLQRALNSVLAQTLPATEIIVVDDGSTDDTFAFMQHFCQQHPQCRYLRHDSPLGACAARNKAIAAATAEYITGLDDDDEILPDHLACLNNAFNREKAFVASSILQDTGANRIARKLDIGELSLNSMLHYNKAGNQVFTLTERLRAIGGFDESFLAFQDYDTWVRLIERFGPAEKIASATYVWHTGHELNRISSSPVKRLTALEMFKQKHAHLLNQQHLASLEIMRIRMAGEPFSLFTLLKLLNTGNWKAAIALYFNANLTGLKKFIDRMRRK